MLLDPRHARDHMKERAALLAQMSPEEVNRYLSSRAFALRETSGKSRAIIPDSLYVVVKEIEDEETMGKSFECGYFLGITYFEPPLILPTSNQLREIWEYLMTLPENRGWCEFQQFIERKIVEALYALQRYEEMLQLEVTSLHCALLSYEGVHIHNALYSQARETRVALNEQARLLKRSNAPIFMQNEISQKMNLAKRILAILVCEKPRM